jgi:hypothetical protein
VKREVPERILELTHLTTDEATHVTQVSAGVDASMIVLKNGDVYSWGRTKGGRIGLGSGCGPTVTQPRKVQLGEFDRRAVACDVGYVHSLIVTATGQILQCGKVGVDDEADGGSEQLEGDDVVAKVLDGPGANVWQRQREPIETIVQEKYKVSSRRASTREQLGEASLTDSLARSRRNTARTRPRGGAR